MSNLSWGQQEASPAFVVGVIVAMMAAFICMAAIAPSQQTQSTGAIAVSTTSSRFNLGHLCRATISMIMGRPISIIRVDSLSARLAHVSYTRPDDGGLWQQKCKTDGNHVVWGAPDGRWRDMYDWEERMIFSFKEQGERLVINQRHPDGSGQTQEFHWTEF